MKNQRNPTQKKAMIAALEKALGIVTTACKSVGIDRSTHYDWLKNDEQYKDAVESISDIALDMAESQLHKQILSGEVSATIFYLKTKGKRRGYIERVEQTGADGEPIKVIQELVHVHSNVPLASSEDDIKE